MLCDSFFLLLSSGHLSHLSSFYPHLPFSSIASHLLHISSYPPTPAPPATPHTHTHTYLSFLFSSWPCAAVGSDRTTWLTEKGWIPFGSPVDIKQECVQNLKPSLKTWNTDRLNCGCVRGQIVHKRTGKGFFWNAICLRFPAWNGNRVWRQTQSTNALQSSLSQ